MEKLISQIDSLIKAQKEILETKYEAIIKKNDLLKSKESKKRYKNKKNNNIQQIDNIEVYNEIG